MKEKEKEKMGKKVEEERISSSPVCVRGGEEGGNKERDQ